MIEFITEKSKKDFFEYLNIEKKQFFMRRIQMTVMLTALYIGLMIIAGLNKSHWWLVGIPIVAVIGYKIPYVELVNARNKQILLKQYMFPSFLRNFISLLSTEGNVYLTIKETLHHVDEPLKQLLEKLIDDLENPDVPDYEAFMDFANEINTSEAVMIMNMIYDFSVQGINKDEIKELEDTIIRLQENKVDELINIKVNKINKYANPIIFIAIVYMIAFVGIVTVSYLGLLSNSS